MYVSLYSIDTRECVNYDHIMQQLYELLSNDNEVRLKNIKQLYVIHDNERTRKHADRLHYGVIDSGFFFFSPLYPSVHPFTIHNKPMGMICRPWRAWRVGAHVFRCCDIRNSDPGLV